jgi:hypothetical protein
MPSPAKIKIEIKKKNALDELRERERRALGAGHEEALEDDLVEVGVGAAGQEAVQLDQEADVGVLRRGLRALDRLEVLEAEIDTHGGSGPAARKRGGATDPKEEGDRGSATSACWQSKGVLKEPHCPNPPPEPSPPSKSAFTVSSR